MLQDLRRGERGLASMLVLSYTFVMYGLYLLKPARDSLFLTDRSAADLPLAFILTAVLAIPITLVYGRASRTWSQPRLLGAMAAWAAVGLVVWWVLLRWANPAIVFLFYAWTGVAGGLITSQFWLLGNAICDARQAKRLFPLLSLGGIAGAVLGGWSTDRAAAWLGVDAQTLVLVTAGVWALAIGFAAVALRLAPPRGARPASPRRRSPVRRTPWRSVLASRHLILITGTVSVSVVVSTFADFLFKTAAASAFPEQAALLGYLGKFYAGMNLAGFALQLLLTSRVLRGLGVGGALLVLPTLLSLGTSALVVAPGLITASVLRGAEMSLKYSLDKTSRELIYLPLPLGLKRQVKVFVDTFVERGSRGLAGLLLLLATAALGLSLPALGVVVLVLILVWIALAVAMRRQYIQSFRRAVARREIGRDDLRVSLEDPQAVAALTASLESDEPREIAYALAALRSVPASGLPGRVTDLLEHPAPEVRLRAIALVADARLDGREEAARRLLRDQEPETGRLAAEYLHRTGGDEALRRALEDRDEASRASIYDYLARLPIDRPVPALAGLADLEELIDPAAAVGARLQVAAASLLGRCWEGDLDALLATVGEARPGVAGRALVGLGRRRERRHLAGLRDLLDDRRWRPWARRALRAYGPVAIPTLVDLGVDRSRQLATRRAALRVLAQATYQRTVDVILSHLETGDDDDRAVLVPVLLRLRERRESLRFPRRTVEKLLQRESAESRRLLVTATQLGSTRGDPADHLLRRVLAETRRHRLERLFQLLALRYDVRDIMGAWLRVTSDDPRRRADALEFLENLLSPHHRALVDRAYEVGRRESTVDREAALLALLQRRDPWLRSCAIWAARPHPYGRLIAEIRRLVDDPDPLVAETARVSLDVERRTGTMLTTIEKAILLQRVEQFDTVDTEQLAAIAAIAEELEFAAGDAIYRAGDVGDAMYLVVDGEVSLRRGEQEIVRAAAGEAFGTWALFEVEARMVTAEAVDACRVLRIDREDFADLMAEDVVVAQGLLRSIARRLRELAARAA
ncbi:cyclic nucleotide-binding domain-containing protein [bacterium]|nr:cyclic nucleotide-binding domain-containing protein [bacterium]